MLPELDGLEVCKLLKRDPGTTHIPTLLLERRGCVQSRERLLQDVWHYNNLVDNAIKYGQAEGVVTVGARWDDQPTAEIWVRDNGPGIPPEATERIFERFYRVDRAREQGGTGLGLSIVKHIVQTHGGEV